MSITNDIRGYADNALEQGKQVAGKATATANDLRAQAEKTLNIDAIKTVVEPYLAQAKQYGSTVTDRAEGLFESVKSDKRVAKVVATAESFTGVVVDTVQDRVVKPVASLTGHKPTAQQPTKAPSTRPSEQAPAKKAPAKKATTRKAAAPTKRAAE